MAIKALTFRDLCDTIKTLNRGAGEHQYPLAEQIGAVCVFGARAKGYLRRSAFLPPLALGIRENTRMTVTVQ